MVLSCGLFCCRWNGRTYRPRRSTDSADLVPSADYTRKNEVPAGKRQGAELLSVESRRSLLPSPSRDPPGEVSRALRSIRRLLQHRRPLLDFVFDQCCQRGRGALFGFRDHGAEIEQALADALVVKRLDHG